MRYGRNQTKTLLPIALLLGATALLVYAGREQRRAARDHVPRPRMLRAPARRPDGVAIRGDGPVRQAGPEEMRDPPRHWDRQDEAVDESFPASDPPANY
ncbi:hypothetical protein [Tranquillimonas alkanivorans]|uniref:Uncharacterized protein n=1 Tax=Tranquillimonas alkanivorans TaxID=441119 RepID=A0A1I5TZ90_9RHOB|nr:hypothetical protein [Tranquillimonas alkanivorans]SFP88354.1 hypothetical protein SAMN04488047_11630 [Tranquillimonas alkanivorans]